MTSVAFPHLLAAILLLAPEAGEQDLADVIHERYAWIQEQYESTDFSDASQRLRRERYGTHIALLDLLDESDRQGSKLRVIRHLADMRSKDAVDPLIKQISIGDPHALIRIGDPLVAYPAATALVDIGQPAVRAILQRARLKATEHELRLFATVIYMHYGAEHEVGRFHIELMLNKAQAELDRQDERRSSRSVTWHRNLTRILNFYNEVCDAAKRGGYLPIPFPEMKEDGQNVDKGL